MSCSSCGTEVRSLCRACSGLPKALRERDEALKALGAMVEQFEVAFCSCDDEPEFKGECPLHGEHQKIARFFTTLPASAHEMFLDLEKRLAAQEGVLNEVRQIVKTVHERGFTEPEMLIARLVPLVRAYDKLSQ